MSQTRDEASVWALQAARRWVDNMVGGMRRIGMTVGDPSDRMYFLSAKMIDEAYAPALAEAERRGFERGREAAAGLAEKALGPWSVTLSPEDNAKWMARAVAKAIRALSPDAGEAPDSSCTPSAKRRESAPRD